MSLAVLIVGVKDIPGEVGKKMGMCGHKGFTKYPKRKFKRAVFRGFICEAF